MSNKMTWEKAIIYVLRKNNTPLHYGDIAEQIISQNLLGATATPERSASSIITTSINTKREKSPFLRVGSGMYTLRELHDKAGSNLLVEEQPEVQYDIITSFGMFWRREQVDWSSATPKIFGEQKQGMAVDFCMQRGVYLLYDNREVIYVGRATDGSLGKRLCDHTKDRLSARWDRFSWFGFLPVSEEGKLLPTPKQYEADKAIPALEAVLIEALEPVQNRSRGDGLGAVEYTQKISPELEQKVALKTLQKFFK